jgi:hypothetical protein
MLRHDDVDTIATQIKAQFESNDNYLFTQVWRDSPYLYIDKIPEEYRSWNDILVWFEVDTYGIKWVNDYEISLVKDRRQEDIFEFKQDLKVSGYTCYSIGCNQFKNPTSYSLTLRAYRYPDSYTVRRDIISLWNKEQKILNDHNQLIAQKYSELNLGDISLSHQTDYGAFTSIWAKSDKANVEQTHATSYYYYRELIDAYDQLRFCVANLNLYTPYTSDYLAKERQHTTGVFYDINLSMYDRRYLNFCGMAFEKLYSFWERIAYLAYQFIQPTTLKNPKTLSFSKRMTGLHKECISGIHPQFQRSTSCYQWFLNFELQHHKDIQYYRHPLIHYKNKNDIYKGSYFAGTLKYWSQNSFDRQKIEELQGANNQLGVFLTTQAGLCSIAIENLIGLIKELS